MSISIIDSSNRYWAALNQKKNLDLEKLTQPAQEGLDSAVYSTAVEQGYSMSMEQAIQYALEVRNT